MESQSSEKPQYKTTEKCDVNGDAAAQEFPYTTIDGIPFREWLGDDADANQVDSVTENADTALDIIQKTDKCMKDAKSKPSIALVAPLPPRKVAPKSYDSSNKDDAKGSSKGEPDAEMEPEASARERTDERGTGGERSWVAAPGPKGKGGFKGLRGPNGYDSNGKGGDKKGKMSSKDANGKFRTAELAANLGEQVEKADFGYQRATRIQERANHEAGARTKLTADPQSSPSGASTRSTRTSTPARSLDSAANMTWVQKKVEVARKEWVEKEKKQVNMHHSGSSSDIWATKYKGGWKDQSVWSKDASWWPKYTKRTGSRWL